MQENIYDSEKDEVLRKNLRHARLLKRYTQNKAATMIDVNENYICRLENGIRKVPAVILYELCQFYEVRMEDMFSESFIEENPLPKNYKKVKNSSKTRELMKSFDITKKTK